MTVLPAQTLQKQIHGAELRRQKIEVDIQRLLQYLRTHDKELVALLWGGIFPEVFQKEPFLFCAVRHEKLRVEQHHPAVGKLVPQESGQCLCFFYCVHDHTRASSLCKSRRQQMRESVLLRKGQLQNRCGAESESVRWYARVPCVQVSRG